MKEIRYHWNTEDIDEEGNNWYYIYLFMDLQLSKENWCECRKKTAEPTPAILIKSGLNEMWPFPFNELMNKSAPLLWLLLEKKQCGRSWFWAWSQSIASICCSIGTFSFNDIKMKTLSAIRFRVTNNRILSKIGSTTWYEIISHFLLLIKTTPFWINEIFKTTLS